MCDRKYKFSLGFCCILGPGECYMFISPQRLHSLPTDIGEREEHRAVKFSASF